MNLENAAFDVATALEYMRPLAASGLHDPEVDHADADDILCAVLRALAVQQADTRYAELVRLYEQVQKWYA